MTIRTMTQADEPWVWYINEAHKSELSEANAARIAYLRSRAFAARVADPQAAFMIAFDHTADYDSPNFLWFRERYPHFAYVDRVAVSADHRRKGLAAAMYDDLFDLARVAGYATVTCEVNSDPPNPGSDAFHAARGFEIVGEAELPGYGKTVRYMACSLR